MLEWTSCDRPKCFGALFFLSTCMAFVMTGFDRMVYPFLYFSAFLGTCLLFCARERVNWGCFSSSFWFPFPFLVYTAITPALPFKDLPVADIMFSAYIVGVAAAFFFARTYWIFILCLALTLTGSFVLFVLLGFPGEMILDERLVLFLHHPNVMGSVAAWCVLFFAATHKKYSQKEKLLLIVLLSPCVLALALSVGRSAYIGFIAAIFFLSCMIWKKYLIRILLALFALSLLTYALLPEQQQRRMLSAMMNPLEDATFKSRLPIWLVVCDGIERSPWLGNSVRGFFAHHRQYVEAHKEILAQKHPYTEPVIGHPHSMYLGILYVNGILGTFLFCVAFTPAIRRAWREQDLFFLSVIVFYLGYGLLEYGLHRKDGILMLFFPLGLVYGRELLAVSQGQTPRADDQKHAAKAE